MTSGQLEISQGFKVDASALYNAATQTPGITVDANKLSRVFYLGGGTTEKPIELIGLTITGGKASGEEWEENDGGGVYVYWGATTLTNCLISDNSAANGGVYDDFGATTLTNCSISDNSAANGGGVYADYGATILANRCFVDGNLATNDGSLYFTNFSDSTLTNCLISGNKASANGGGVFTCYSTTTLTNCAVAANTATKWGGGLYVALYVDDEATTLRNSIVALNKGLGLADVYRVGTKAALDAYNVLSGYTAWSNAGKSGG